MSRMFCVSCGAKNPDGAKFCFKCGAAIVETSPEAHPASNLSPAASNPSPAAPNPSPAAANPSPAVVAAAPAAAKPAPAAAAPVSRSREGIKLAAGILIALFLVALALLIMLNGLQAVLKIMQTYMGDPVGRVIGLILIVLVVGIVGSLVSFVLKPLRSK